MRNLRMNRAHIPPKHTCCFDRFFSHHVWRVRSHGHINNWESLDWSMRACEKKQKIKTNRTSFYLLLLLLQNKAEKKLWKNQKRNAMKMKREILRRRPNQQRKKRLTIEWKTMKEMNHFIWCVSCIEWIEKLSLVKWMWMCMWMALIVNEMLSGFGKEPKER